MQKRFLSLLCAAALGIGLSTAATAQFEEAAAPSPARGADQLLSGADLYKHRHETGWVSAYVAGVIDSDATGAAASHLKYCLPPHGSLSEYTEVVVGYLAANPRNRSEAGSDLVHESLAGAFACGAK